MYPRKDNTRYNYLNASALSKCRRARLESYSPIGIQRSQLTSPNSIASDVSVLKRPYGSSRALLNSMLLNPYGLKKNPCQIYVRWLVSPRPFHQSAKSSQFPLDCAQPLCHLAMALPHFNPLFNTWSWHSQNVSFILPRLSLFHLKDEHPYLTFIMVFYEKKINILIRTAFCRVLFSLILPSHSFLAPVARLSIHYFHHEVILYPRQGGLIH